MAKKRKTRAQKKLSDFRHNFTHAIINQNIVKPQVQFESIKPSQTLPRSTSATSYPYLIKDLSKTAVLTLAVLAAQIILYFLLTNHLFKIPGLNY